jgi:transposase InsO family protein
VAPATSLARARKRLLDRVTRGEVTVSAACAQAGISRSWFYELRARYERYGEAGLLPKPRPQARSRRCSPALVDAIVGYAVEHPTEGPRAIAANLALPRFGGWKVSHGGVYNVLCRAGLNRRRMRLAAAEAVAAAEGGPITERALRDLRAVERQRLHIGSETVGDEVFLDTMYVGNLKGVGKIWQHSAVDGACSFGFAQARLGPKSAVDAAAFLEHHVLPVYRELGVPLRQVTTDGGPEYTGLAFRRTCARLGIRWRKLPPRSPNLNAFVERFQGSVLHLHYRTAFRYRFYDDVDVLDADLQAWLRHYNFERPHRGYRLNGRRPADVFYAARPDLLTAKGWTDEPHPALSLVRA